MVRRIELFESDSILNLKHRVNEFLSDKRGEQILDIQYDKIGSKLDENNNYGDSWDLLYTALIFYEDGKPITGGDVSVPIEGGGNL